MAAANLPAVIDRPAAGMTTRQEFGAQQLTAQAETAMAAVTAREQAIIQAEYIMAERHPRVWMNVRSAMLDHCKRPRFSDISRYSKPVGKKFVNGEWVEQKATGFTARFAETLAQEMGSVKPWSQVTFEDDLIRIVRIGVTDLQRNLPRSREVSFAKTVERKGRKDKRTGEWQPPEGREVISQRLNSYGEPTYLVKATEDEMRAKVNSEESKTQRDFILRLCPRDVLEDCEDQVLETMQAEDRRDPLAALKKLLDRFKEFGLIPSDLEQYIGRPVGQFTGSDIQELRELGAAIRDGQTSFQESLRAKYSTGPEDGAPAQGELAEMKVEQLQATARSKRTPTAERRAAAAELAARAEDKPPTFLEDQAAFSTEMTPWQKVRGVIYRFDEAGGNYKVYEPAGSPGRKESAEG